MSDPIVPALTPNARPRGLRCVTGRTLPDSTFVIHTMTDARAWNAGPR